MFFSANKRANDTYWTKWETWQKGIAPGGKYARIEWTHDYRVRTGSRQESVCLVPIQTVNGTNSFSVLTLVLFCWS